MKLNLAPQMEVVMHQTLELGYAQDVLMASVRDFIDVLEGQPDGFVYNALEQLSNKLDELGDDEEFEVNVEVYNSLHEKIIEIEKELESLSAISFDTLELEYREREEALKDLDRRINSREVELSKENYMGLITGSYRLMKSFLELIESDEEVESFVDLWISALQILSNEDSLEASILSGSFESLIDILRFGDVDNEEYKTLNSRFLTFMRGLELEEDQVKLSEIYAMKMDVLISHCGELLESIDSDTKSDLILNLRSLVMTMDVRREYEGQLQDFHAKKEEFNRLRERYISLKQELEENKSTVDMVSNEISRVVDVIIKDV